MSVTQLLRNIQVSIIRGSTSTLFSDDKPYHLLWTIAFVLYSIAVYCVWMIFNLIYNWVSTHGFA